MQGWEKEVAPLLRLADKVGGKNNKKQTNRNF